MPIDRPLKLGELVAETVRLYGERIWAAGSIALLLAGALLAASVVDHLKGLAPAAQD